MLLLLGVAMTLLSCVPEPEPEPEPEQYLKLVRVMAGDTLLSAEEPRDNVPFDVQFSIEFDASVDTLTVPDNVLLVQSTGDEVPLSFSFSVNQRTIFLDAPERLFPLATYTLTILDSLKGTEGETYAGISYTFTTMNGEFSLISVTLNEQYLKKDTVLRDIDPRNIAMEFQFSDVMDPVSYSSFFTLSRSAPVTLSLGEDQTTVTLTNTATLDDYKEYIVTVSENLTSTLGVPFEGFNASFHTTLDSTYKFPEISDDELLELIQRQSFRYFYDFAHPTSGMARERLTSGEIVTSGGTGFGLMAMVAAMERGFITREEGLAHLEKVLTFLETCDRFHGAWSHWISGFNGRVLPFSPKDNGADLVETAFLIQGLLTVRQYLDSTVTREDAIRDRINVLWEEVEWDWFTRDGEEVLYWHWSPNYEWDMNFPLRGYNETLITYILAASSPTHTISADVYHNGYAKNGEIANNKSFYGITLPLGYDYGGPLFFAHYSFLGLDPRNLSDRYANYWEQNVNHTLINYMYVLDNPKKYKGYSADCWGLTASDGNLGYSAHSPTNDRGVITPTAAISSIPFTPDESMDAIRHFYYRLGDKLWGDYGFYDAFNLAVGWWAPSYLAIDQGPEIVMIENYRTGLIWELFMSAPEIQAGLEKLDFTYGE
ncbi:glucoamylase family protein [Bacteroidota bacterium]